MTDSLLQVDGLKKHFQSSEGLLNRDETIVKAVEDVSFEIERGETYALVGESGSGKTTAGKSILRIHEPTAGVVRYNGESVADLRGSDLKKFRRNAQMIFQDPDSSLNPRSSIRKIIRRPLDIHNIGSRADRREKVKSIVNKVDLPAKYLNRYPNALSGGQKQRVGIARALITDPSLLVLDEPTSALDVSVQAKIISLLKDLQSNLDLAYLFISHDLSLMENFSDRIGVMYLGEIVETGPTDQLFQQPTHPYTRSLLQSIPVFDETNEAIERLQSDEPPQGEIPDPADVPSGCSFHPRCPQAESKCRGNDPSLEHREGINADHLSACHFPVVKDQSDTSSSGLVEET